MINEDRIWHLIALQLAGEACNDELRELDHLLKVNPDKYYIREILHHAWEVPAVQDKEEGARAFEILLKKMELREIDSIPYQPVKKPE